MDRASVPVHASGLAFFRGVVALPVPAAFGFRGPLRFLGFVPLAVLLCEVSVAASALALPLASRASDAGRVATVAGLDST